MADPDISSFQIARNSQATGELHDPVTGEKRITGAPRLAVDLNNVAWLTEDEQ